MSKVERNYAQIEREGLAVIFGVSKFHKYIYGQEFTIITDHKPLLGLFKEDRAISPTGSARVQRWTLVLASYHYQLVYKPGSKISNEDGLGRQLIEDCYLVSFRLNPSHVKNCCFLHIKRPRVITSA